MVFHHESTLLRADSPAPVPIFLAHGSADAVIPVEHSRRLATRGSRFRHEEIPGGNRDSPMCVDLGAAMIFYSPHADETVTLRSWTRTVANPQTRNLPPPFP